MKKLATLFSCILITSVALFAVPAIPGYRNYVTTDGKTVSLQMVGDEYGHWLQDADGKTYQLTEQQTVRLTSLTPRERSNKRRQMLSKRRAMPADGIDRPQKGYGTINLAPRGLVILVNFTDVAFQAENTKAEMYQMMNGASYTHGNTYGSVREYFRTQSNGTYVPTFDVVGPVTVKKQQSYYGQNDEDDNDMYAGDLIIEACKAADAAGTDFTRYDNDGDGYVDFVYVIYADKGEADGGATYTVWPHNWNIRSAAYYGNCTYNFYSECKVDGLYINSYACSGELNGRTDKRNSIGTIAHEFGHVLGLPDHYDTGNGLNKQEYRTPGTWDIMDSGSYNGNDDEGNPRCGTCPPNYSVVEKALFGWVTPVNPGNTDAPITLNYNGSEQYNTYQINASGTKQSVTYEGVNYYIENRQQIGWDQYLPGHGMIVWYVNFDEDLWVANKPNNTEGEPRLTILSAKGSQTNIGTSADPYPGYYEVQFVSFANRSLTNITEQNNIVTCNYLKEEIEEPVSADFCIQSANDRSVFFTKPSSWSDDIYVYMWVNGTTTSLVGEWPGAPAEQVGAGTYRFRVPSTITSDMDSWMIIWNDRSSQSADLAYVNHAHYSGKGSGAITIGAEITTICPAEKNHFTCAEVNQVYDRVEGSLNPFTVAYINGTYNYVYDATGMTLVYGKQNWSVGQTVSGVEGYAYLYQTLPEFAITNTSADWTITTSAVPEFEKRSTIPTAAEVNQVYNFQNVTFSTDVNFTTSAKGTTYMTINGERVKLYNQFKIAQTFQSDTRYSLTGAVGLYNNEVEVFFISAEEYVPDTVYITMSNAEFADYSESENWWQIYGYVSDSVWVSVASTNANHAVGTFDMSQLDADYTGIDIYRSATQNWEHSAFQSGTFTLYLDADGYAHLSGTAYGLDGTVYILTIDQAVPNYPTPAYLAKRYDGSANVVMAIRFDGEVCNDIYLVGSYPANNWSTEVSTMVQMTPLTAYPGWYAAQIPATDANGNPVQAKPVQLMNDGTFSWLYQTGDTESWEHKDGSYADISAGYDEEADIIWPGAGYYVYVSKYFKKHKSPCNVVYHDYRVMAFMPESCMDDIQPHITGDFNNWQLPGVAMTVAQRDEQGHPVLYKAEVTAIQGSEYQICGGDWDNGKLLLNNTYVGNQIFPEDTAISPLVIHDYSQAVYNGCRTFINPDLLVSVPYTCSFDTDEENAPWQFANDSVNRWIVNDSAYYSSPYSLYISNEGKAWGYTATSIQTSYAYVYMHLDEGVYNVRFNCYVEGEYNYDYLSAYLEPYEGVQLTGGAIYEPDSSYVLISRAATIYGRYDNDVTISQAGTYRLIFMWHNDGSVAGESPALIDNITIDEVRCRRPGNLQVADVTETEALIGWTTYSDADKYELMVNNQSYFTTEDMYVVEHLTPGTYYTAGVRAICGSDTSQTVTTSFSTSCPASYSVPYSNGMEDEPSYVTPLCWTIHQASRAYSYTYDGAAWAYNSNKFLLMEREVENMDTLLVVMPAFSEPLNNLRLRFRYRTYSTATTTPQLVVGYVTNRYDPATFVPTDTLERLSVYSDVPTQILFDKASRSGYIAFTLTTGNSELGEYYLDDFVVDKIPDCYEPTELVMSNVTSTSASVSWTSDASMFTIYYTDGTQVQTKVSTENHIELTDLTINTQYTVYVMAMCGFGQMSGTSQPVVFRTYSQPSGNKSGHDYIDLGLTSGTLWATANVAADAPEHAGNYYAWGEIDTKSSYTVENSLTYDNATYNFDIAGNPLLDAATAAWGEQWRMPTLEQWTELVDEAQWISVRINGTAGFQITGQNGNSLFLPAVGTMEHEQLTLSTRAYYFSSTPDAGDVVSAYCMDVAGITSKRVRLLNRWYGLAVRPVVAPRDDQPTNLSNLQVEAEQPKKVLRNGLLYILRGNEVYDITGRKLQ